MRGPATAPDASLPTTGEHVAFWALFVLSREAAISGTHPGVRVSVGGIPVSGSESRINAVKGFRFFETSGDFTVAEGTSSYIVKVSGIIGYFAKGASRVSFAGDMAKQAGVPGQFWNDSLNFTVAEQALKMFCGYEAPIAFQHQKTQSGGWTRQDSTDYTTASVVTVKSSIDSRIHYYNAGHNIPTGVLELMATRGITLEENEEVIAVEMFIPLNKEVSVFGTFNGEGDIVFSDNTIGLSVSYGEPETMQ